MVKRKKDEPHTIKEKHPAARPPVVVILGHIDHGKTTLLDCIRRTRVAAKEAGGITQKIGAYQVELEAKDKQPRARKITFIDTPGHEAFSRMRQRGAGVADLAVLVVAADDGVKPQTVEAIAHAKAAGIPLVVALNKIDLASPQDVTKVKGQLAKEGVLSEDQGGKVPVVSVSAKTGQGVPELLEMISLVADLLEIKEEKEAGLEAVVIESLLSSQQGPLATVVVKKGVLRVGDPVFAGAVSGRVKALVNDLGGRIAEAGPGDPAQVLGFSAVPPVGAVVSSQLPVASSKETKESELVSPPVTQSTGTTSLNVVLRADTQGALEAIVSALDGLNKEGKGVNLLLKSVGPIGDADVRLASTTKGVVLGFNVPIGPSAQKLADDFGVGVRSFPIIYELLEVAEKLVSGAKALEEEEKNPEAEVLAVFTLRSGDIVAGARALNGKIKYRDRVRVTRSEEEVHQGKVRGLKIGKDEVSEVKAGQEAGILVKPVFEFRKGDRIVVSSN